MRKINKFTCLCYFPHLHRQFNIRLADFSYLKTALFRTCSANSLRKEYCLAVLFPMTKNFTILMQFDIICCALEEGSRREFCFLK